MASGIYKLTFTNGYFYFGQAVNLRLRKSCHFNDLKALRHCNKILQNCFNKYGLPSFQIVLLCNINDLDYNEIYFLHKYKNSKRSCNITYEPRSSRGRPITDELRKKFSEAKKRLTPQGRINISEAQKGKKISESQKQKAREWMINAPQDYRERMRLLKLGTYTGTDNHAAKMCFNVETGIFYDTVKEGCNSQTKYNYAYFKCMVGGSQRNKTKFILCS